MLIFSSLVYRSFNHDQSGFTLCSVFSFLRVTRR